MLRDGVEVRGNSLPNTFVGPTLTVSTPFGNISSPNGPFSDVTLHMRGGNDTLIGGGSNSAIYGNDGNDLINVAGGDLTLSGGLDNDTIITTSSGGSWISGGQGNDSILVTRSSHVSQGDTVWGGDGNDHHPVGRLPHRQRRSAGHLRRRGFRYLRRGGRDGRCRCHQR